MNELLTFAADLERRDAEVGAALHTIERLQHEVGELASRSSEVSAFLAALPASLAERRAEQRLALEARTRAESLLQEAEAAAQRARRDDERLVAEHGARRARDDIDAAERVAAGAAAEQKRLEREGDAHAEEAKRLTARAAELSGLVEDVASPGSDLPSAIEWASRARGALLVKRAVLDRDRDALAREASELVSSVLGESQTINPAALRGRLERALAAD